MKKPGGFGAKPPAAVPQAPDPRLIRNHVRQVLAQSLAGAAGIYSQLSPVVEQDLGLEPGTREYIAQALGEFAAFHDSIGAAMGELSPSHHDRELFLGGEVELPE